MSFGEFDQRADDLIDESDGVNAPEAIKLLQEALKYVGTSKYMAYKAYLGLGMRYQELGRHREAVENLTSAMNALGEDPLALLWRGESFRELGETDRALKDFEAAVEFPDDEALDQYDYDQAVKYITELGGTVRPPRPRKLPEPKEPEPEFNPLDSEALVRPEGKIAFDGRVEDQVDVIFTIAADGSGLTQLTHHSEVPSFDNDPVWSPDGTTIAFSGTRFTGWNVGLMDADGGNRRQLTAGHKKWEERTFDFRPSWSPDGRKIVFESNRDAFEGRYKDANDHQRMRKLYVVDVASGDIERITHDPQAHDRSPDWSPDGKRILFISWDANGESIQTVEPDGRNRQTLASEESYAFGLPRWSPDGQSIIFHRRAQGFSEHVSDVMIMDVASGEIRLLADRVTPEFRVRYSPDGRHIAFTSSRYKEKRQHRLFIANADGTGVSQLVDLPFPCGSAHWI